MAKVGIVIVNYNGRNYQNDCIQSIYDMQYKDAEIIVVDSGSKDDSIKLLKDSYPNVHVLEQSENVGVAKGNNIGIEYSLKLGTKYTLLMNNDVVLDSCLLDKLIEKTEGKYVTVPKIYYYEPDDLLWFAGGDFDFRKGTVFHYGMKEKDNGQYDEDKFIKYSPTCCMLIPNHVFDSVGMMDEKYFMYYDDCDFCLRLMDKGIKLLYVPHAIMWHKVSSSTGGESSPLAVYYMTRNRFYFIRKYPGYMPFSTKFYSYFSNIAQYLLSPIRCRNDKYILPAMIDYRKNRMGRKDNLIRKR